MNESDSVYLPFFSPVTLKLPSASVIPPPTSLLSAVLLTRTLTKPSGVSVFLSRTFPFTRPWAVAVRAATMSREKSNIRFITVIFDASCNCGFKSSAPFFRFLTVARGLEDVCTDTCPAARPDPREVRDTREHHAKPLLQRSHARTQRSCAKWEHHAKPLLQRSHARTQRVPRSGTSMRNPLQAALRRSCGYMQPHAHYSAKRDLHTHFAAKSVSTAALSVMQHTRLRQRKGRTAETGTANPLIFNGFTPA